MNTHGEALPDVDVAGPRVHFLAWQSAEQWAWAGAITIAAELRRALEQRPRARLLLSGGKTPAPVYQALARAPLAWDRVDVALVDERWLQPDDPDSNSHLVRTTLLQDKAAKARFETLTRTGRSIEEAVAAANLHASQAPDVVTLGMGDDGHTASLFPGMLGLEQARPGNHLGDISAAIQRHAEKHRYGVVRDFCGHGVGRVFHDAPDVVHVGRPGTGPELKPGMFFTVEPMINIGRPDVKLLDDGWTAVTRDRTLSAQFEHSIGITEDGCEIFTKSPKGLDAPPY